MLWVPTVKQTEQKLKTINTLTTLLYLVSVLVEYRNDSILPLLFSIDLKADAFRSNFCLVGSSHLIRYTLGRKMDFISYVTKLVSTLSQIMSYVTQCEWWYCLPVRYKFVHLFKNLSTANANPILVKSWYSSVIDNKNNEKWNSLSNTVLYFKLNVQRFEVTDWKSIDWKYYSNERSNRSEVL